MANGFAAGLAGGLDGLVQFLKYRTEQQRMDRAEQMRQEQLDMQRQTQQLQMEQIRQAMSATKLQHDKAALELAQVPQKQAQDTFAANVQVKGLEGALDDPQALNQLTKAGVSMPHQPYLMAAPDMPQGQADALNEAMGLFPRSGIVKSPEILQDEAKRNLAIQQARTVQRLMGSMLPAPGEQGGGGVAANGFVDNAPNRIAMKLGLNINPNDVFGPIRETPEEAAAKAGAVAKAQLPFRKEVADYILQNRVDVQGDPVFNQTLQSLVQFLPMEGQLQPGQVEAMVAAAKRVADAANRVSPRNQPQRGGNNPIEPPPDAAPQLDVAVQQARDKFGSWDAVIQQAQDPGAQARMKQIGIDPNAFLRRAQAQKILERMKGQQ